MNELLALCETAFWWVIGATLEATVIIALILAVQALLRDRPQREPQIEHVLVGEVVERLGALAFRLHKAGLPQDLQVLRDVCDRHVCLGSERLYVSRALGKQVQQLQTSRAGQGVADTGEFRVDLSLELSMRHTGSIEVCE